MENLNKTSNNLQGTFPASEASLIDIIGTKVETDENGAITKGGWEKLNNTLEMYSDKRYETARYLFVKDGKIVRHVAVSSKTPASTAVKPDDDFLLKLRTYAEETDSKVIFIHNHPSGYVMPSENDVNLTKYLESVFIDNGGKARFLGHAILDHGNYGLYTKKSGWAAMTDGEIRPLSDLDKNYSSDEKNYGLRIKGKEELVALAEKAKSLDSLEIWNKQDWIPAFFASASKIVKSHDYIGKNEFSNTRSLAEKLKSIGRNHNSENVYFFPSTREQQLQCEAFAQTTGLVANIVFRNEDGNFELSDYSGGTLFSDTRAKDISVEDTNSLDRSEIERKLFEATDNNTNETLSTQAKKDGNMKNTNTQTIESNEVVGVGFAPTIQTLRMGASSTRLRASPTTENIIAQDENPVNKKNHIAANFVLEKLKAANIEVIADKSEMLSILESGKLVQKMAAFHGTSGAEKSFNGYGTYVVSVNEGDAKQIGMRVASKKYGDAFYVKGQAFETFLKEHKFSPYWAELLKQSRLDNVEELQTTMMLSDTKGNAELERQKNELSTLFKYGLVEHKREKAFVYSIDIPDDDGRNYLPYENPIGLESAEKINAALERLGTRWRVTRNDGGRQVYFNTLSEKVFGGSQEEASKFLKDAGLVGMRMNDRNYIVFDEKDISVNRRVQFMTDKNGEIYGFAHGGKIYLDPDLMNANTPAHEYTHLWDAYTRQTNLKLWERGKDIFRQTRLWNEVKGDPNYADIADDDDLLLSEVHARICGDIAQKVLERVAEQDGEIARDRAIDWDKEVTEYIASELGAEIAMPELGSESYVSDSIRHEVARNFLAQPMKDLMAGKGITLEREQEKSELYKENEAELKFIVEEMLEESLPGPQKMAKPAENKKDPAQTQQGLSDVQDTATAISTHIRHQNNIVEIKSQEHFANKFGELANEIGNSASPMQPGEFLDRIKQTFGMDVATETTGYVFSREYGTSFKLRVANHKAVLKNRTGDKTEITSVVIQLCDNKGQDNNKAKLSEFVYFPESLDKETQLGIVSGIKDWISSHEYTDRNYDQMYVSTARALRERLKESERAVQKMAMSKERKETETALSEEDLEYIRSPEFIEKFGDWEKAQRLEKLKAAEAIIADGKIIVEGEEISENLDYLREDKNKKLLQILARNLGRQVVGIYHNDDLNIDVKVSMNNIDEIKHHNILFENHIEAIKNIPEIIQRAIYIGNESNSDKTRHPNITEYKYFATGLKIDGVDYTCKSVIGVDRNGNNYYDQSLSTIEKGRFVDIVMQKNKLGNLSPLISPWESEFEEDSNPSAHYDKRLINICQVPQMKYLDKNLMPGKEAVEAVRNGTLRIEKRGQTEIMVDEARDAETERIQKMAKPAGNENNVAPSTAAESDYADPIETAEAWHNGTDEEREAMTREFASRRRDAASEGGFARVTAESADAGLFKDIHNEMRGDALARSTEDTLSAFRNIERLAAEAGNDAENGRLAREFVASLEERGVYLYKCGQKNLLRILDTRNLAAESGGIPETVPIEEAGSFFWNHHNVRTDGGKSTYDLMAEAHGTAYRRLHAKEAMREILAANGDDHELTDEEAAMLSGAGFRSLESLGDIEKLAAESGKPNLFLKISGAALGREEAVRAAGVERTEAENAEEKPHTNLHSYSVGGQKITLDRKSGTVTMRLTAADSERMRENNFSYDEMENAWTAELSGDSASFALAMKGELHRANLRDSHEEETTREYPASLRLSEDGWLWTHFDDGSGGLNNYGRTNYGASYDRTTREGWLVDENGYSDFIYIRNGYEDDWNTEEFMKMAEESVERHFGLDRREATVREHVGEKTEAENEYDFRDRIESAIVADNEIGAKYRETFDLDDRLGVKGLDDIRVEMLQKIMEQVGGGRNASEGEVANIAQGMLDGGYAERVGRAKRWEFAEKSEIADPERVAAMDALGIDTAIEIFGTLDEPKEVPFELRSELQSLSATMRLEMRAAPTPGEIQKIRDVAGLKGPETESVRERGGANGAEKTFTMFYGAERKPYHPEQVVSVLKKFAEIDSERWNLPPDAKTAVFHLIDVAEIGGGDFQNSVEKFSRYLDGEEYAREEESYAKILEPILMTEIPNFRNHDGSEGELLHGEFAYEFSAGEGAPARDIPRADAGTLEISGGIKSAAGNEFTGENKGVAEEFQKKLVAAGVAKPDEEFVLVNELEAHARGTRVRESSENDFIILNVPVEADGRKEFVQTKYYHVSALEEPQNIARSAEGEKEEPKERTVEVKDENGQTTKVKVEFGKTKVPEFAMITQNGLKTYADMNVRGHDAKANSWTLANEGGEKIVVPDRTLRELISEKQVERAKGFSENTPAVDKMLVAQYEDFFRQRDNTANNFRHNLSVYCRKEANSPIDALKVAKAIINDMPVEERRRTKDLLKALRKDGETVNEVVVRTYLDAVKETPLNEEHLKANRYEKMIARPMYDTVSANGAKVDDNFDLKIGDTVNGIAFKTGKTFGIGKDRILQNCKIISASKENNMVTLMDSDKSFYDVPRDTFLKEYARSEKVEKKQERKESRKKSVMRIDIER